MKIIGGIALTLLYWFLAFMFLAVLVMGECFPHDPEQAACLRSKRIELIVAICFFVTAYATLIWSIFFRKGSRRSDVQ